MKIRTLFILLFTFPIVMGQGTGRGNEKKEVRRQKTEVGTRALYSVPHTTLHSAPRVLRFQTRNTGIAGSFVPPDNLSDAEGLLPPDNPGGTPDGHNPPPDNPDVTPGGGGNGGDNPPPDNPDTQPGGNNPPPDNPDTPPGGNNPPPDNTTEGAVWVGTIDTDWRKALNWRDHIVPKPGENIIFATVANNFGVAAINDLHVDTLRTAGNFINESEKALIILPNQLFTVNESASVNAPERIVIKTSHSIAAGSLIFSKPAQNLGVRATVEMFNKSVKRPAGTYRYTWQYFGIPLQSLDPFSMFNAEGKPFVRRWVENTPNYDKWEYPKTAMSPFLGYEMTYEDTATYRFKGTLVTEDKSVVLTRTPGVSYSGVHVLANPYTAALPIDKIAMDGDVERTVYIYNTGSRDEWLKMNGIVARGFQPGQYIAVPQHLAGQKGLPAQIPSMQGFLVQAWAAGASVGFNYKEVIQNNSLLRSAGATSENRPDDNAVYPYIVIDVEGENSADRAWIFEAPGTTRTFNNGWDGYKLVTPDVLQLYVSGQQGQKFQVSSSSELVGNEIGFANAKNEVYKLRFEMSAEAQAQRLFLLDLKTGKHWRINPFRYYSFTAEAGDAGPRFRIVSKEELADKVPNLRVYTQDRTIVVENNTSESGSVDVFDSLGKLVAQRELKANEILRLNEVFAKGVYIVKVTTQTHNLAERVILR